MDDLRPVSSVRPVPNSARTWVPRGVRVPRVPSLRSLAIGALLSASTFPGACGPEKSGDLSRATADYEGGRYEAALSAARASAREATGLELDRARYLEGLALLRLDRPTDAVAPLREATDASDRTLAADAFVSLGTALIRVRDFDAAAMAYRDAALRLDGAEARRAHDIAARCYERAGLTVAAASERALAGGGADAGAEPTRPGPALGSDSERPAGSAAAAPAPRTPAPPVPSSPTSRIENGIEIEPVRFAVQAGAFSERKRAEEVARSLAESARRAGLAAPRVAERERSGSTLFVVQIGDFPTRLAAGRALAAFGGTGCTVERSLPARR